MTKTIKLIKLNEEIRGALNYALITLRYGNAYGLNKTFDNKNEIFNQFIKITNELLYHYVINDITTDNTLTKRSINILNNNTIKLTLILNFDIDNYDNKYILKNVTWNINEYDYKIENCDLATY